MSEFLNVEPSFGDRRNYISGADPENPTLNLEIGGLIYRFSIASVQPDKRDWFAKTVHRQMMEIHNNAVSKTRLGVQAQIKDALGL